MWFYSAVFVLLAGILSAGYFFNYQKLSYWFCILMLIVIAGFRPSTCCMDYTIYLEYYENIEGLPYTFLEPTYFFITWISKVVFGSAAGVFIIYSILGVGLKGIAFIKLTRFYPVTLLLYYGSFFMLHEMTQIRVGVAAALLLLSIPSIVDRKPREFLFLFILGSLFHYSLIVFGLFYFLKSDKLNPYFYFGMIMSAFIAFLCGFSLVSFFEFVRLGFISDKINTYKMLLEEGQFTDISLINPLLLLRIVIMTFLLYKWEFLYSQNKYAVILIKIYCFSIFCFIALADLPVLAGRLNQLLGVVEMIVVPFLVYVLTPRYFSVIVATLFGVLIMYKQLFYSGIIFPYFNN
jgi:hypothetical protein